MREIVGKKCNIEEVELSQYYIAFYDKFEKINYLMEKIIEFQDCDPDDRTLSHLLSIIDSLEKSFILMMVLKEYYHVNGKRIE